MKLNSYQKSFVCIILFGLIASLSCYIVIKENNKTTSITRRMSTNGEWTDSSKIPYTITFNQGDIIRFNYKSTIKDGKLLLRFVDCQGNLIYEFDPGKNGEKDIKIEKTDIYELFIEGDKFKGNYEIICEKS
ncbi:hypothetical protein [Clostridium beijerinckii]|uniref:Lipoprotein n=1 Tax=Clostridium beijerinckii TaxID=1520 RepID=A0A9Q5CXL8_CLOBE|nr:hypothetical protein [Clostridium beijerinckii]AQS04746.1 hypothetical protein CLBIJ_21760 [Clostridium beijerinckii]MBA2887577.1 hypothetical protein [Clostridium beijerinckii]MBA2902467.1 hypothetical protein [Clostridium beijerinckii]MBA2912243.1 hypothetical protein [Clostridium beijerinckii]MBA9015695.1 hypothetical protein [Clostridium beijerinckii]